MNLVDKNKKFIGKKLIFSFNFIILMLRQVFTYTILFF